MLSVGKVTAGSAAYYEASVARGGEDYYQRGGEAPGVWMGSGLDTVDGVKVGSVMTGSEHAELFEQLRVGGWQLGVPTQSRFVQKTVFDVEAGRTVPVLDVDGDPVLIEQHPVTALDLTFSAPKSVSTVWAAGDDVLGERVWAAHHAAVDAAFGYLEAHGCYTRSGKGGTVVVDGGGFVAARYDHRTSRNLDPQIHSHVLVANRVQRGDDEWRAVDARQVFRQAKTVGMIYQASLRAEIEASTGLRFGPVDPNGQAELINIDPNIVDVFSSRSREIDVAMNEWRRGWIEAHDGVMPPPRVERAMGMSMTLGTRSTKTAEEFTTTELRDRWRSQLVEHRINPDTIVRDSRVARASDAEAVRGVGEMRGEVSSVSGVFSRDDVASEAARYATGATAGEVVANVEAVTDRVLSECVTVEPVDGVDLRASDGRPLIEQPGAAIHTTTGTLDMEQRVMRWCEADGARRVEASLERFGGLDDSQAAAVVQVLGDGNQVSVVVGPAGHGKTTTVTEIAGAWREQYGQVFGVAPSAQASHLLGEAGIGADTIDSYLMNPVARAGDLIVVDEAGMVGTKHLDQLREHAQAVGVKVVLVGDPEQLSAVRKAGGVLADIVDAQPLPGHNLSVAELGVAHRFSNDTASQVAAGLRDRDPGVVGVLEDAGWLHGHQDPVDARAAVVVGAWQDHVAGLDTVILVSTRADAGLLNEAWQYQRLATGELDPQTRDPRSGYHVGEQVMAKQNRRDLTWTDPGGEQQWLRNGTVLTIEEHGRDGGAIGRASGGGRVMVDEQYLKQHTQLAYARTIHSAQGATVDTAHVMMGPSTESHGLYVAGSRGRQATHFHVTQPAMQTGDHSPTTAPTARWSPGDVMKSAMERVDPASRSAHRTMREHRAGQVDVLVAKFDGVTPPAYPAVGDRERLERLIDKTSQLGTPTARVQVGNLLQQLASWVKQNDTATEFDQLPGATQYREQHQAPEHEHKPTHDHGY